MGASSVVVSTTSSSGHGFVLHRVASPLLLAVVMIMVIGWKGWVVFSLARYANESAGGIMSYQLGSGLERGDIKVCSIH